MRILLIFLIHSLTKLFLRTWRWFKGKCLPHPLSCPCPVKDIFFLPSTHSTHPDLDIYRRAGRNQTKLQRVECVVLCVVRFQHGTVRSTLPVSSFTVMFRVFASKVLGFIIEFICIWIYRKVVLL